MQEFPGDAEFIGQNPSENAAITYYLKERHIIGDLKLEVYGAAGKPMTTLPAGKRRGINRVTWAMRQKPPKVTGEEQLRERVVDVCGWVSQYGGRPSESQLARLPVLEREIDAKNAEFEAFVGHQLAAIKPMTKEEYDKKQEK